MRLGPSCGLLSEIDMCGIAGFWEKARTADLEASERTLATMTDSLSHRGPDARGIWLCPQHGIGLGHRRLAIRDLSPAGAQPMVSSNGRFVITFNGEIYNSDELRNDLEKANLVSNWNGTSDTEILLEAVSNWGAFEALSRSIGMFALAIWDRTAGELVLARDRFGEKPLFYSADAGIVIFASELKAMRQHPANSRAVNSHSIEAYLRYGFIPASQSIFCGVSKILPGEIRVFRRVGALVNEESRPFWSHEKELYGEHRRPAVFESPGAAADALLPILRESVRRELISDVPLGAFLSGGVDSSLIVSLMQRLGTKPSKTFTIGFDDRSYDEAPFARAVARHLGTDHMEQYIGNREIFEILPQLPRIYDEPLGDSSQIPTLLLAQIARREVTVCLSGDGGDELFGGYNHYRWGPAVMRLRALIPGALAPAVGSALSWTGTQFSRHGLLRLGELLKARPKADASRLLNAAIADVQCVLSKAGNSEVNWGLPALSKKLLDAEKLMAFDLHGYLPDDILVKVDRAAMRAGLETRVPFLDPAIARFAWSLPLRLRIAPRSGKPVLKEILSRFVPRALFDRPKSGFGLPLDRWFRSELKPMAEKYLLGCAPRYDCWLDPVGICRLWKQHQSGKVNRQRELWVVMALIMWLEENV